ncbi:cytochrome P450 [Yinghuangia seranimata]|uniref:cytochrome P450 n=1 Tax=Yinghuangia seranimata TaxID=408067 RepID=UPI00248C79D3|nr:cytochrome P450 [Yinghuangia seranimata]MDI2125156.1 cytochrome P450 [Yinghuangia seranimata]
MSAHPPTVPASAAGALLDPAFDPFDDAVLADPYPAWARVRDAGPAVHLPVHDVWAIGRYADVRDALRDAETFSSHGGIGLRVVEDPVEAGLPSSVDPPDHDRYRRLMGAQLGPRFLPRLGDMVKTRAEDLVDELLARGEFDAVADWGRTFPVEILGDLVGLPLQGRGSLTRWAAAVFDNFGPDNARSKAAAPLLEELVTYVSEVITRENLDPEGMGAKVFEAADRGEVNDVEAMSVIMTFLVSGMGTTSDALAQLLLLLAEHPDQWAALRANPALISGVFEEVLRYDAPVQAFFRTVTRDTDVDGVKVPAGARAMLLFGSANRDGRKWADPDRFDVGRNPVDHLAFGSGTHSCAGQALARLEARALLVALVRNVERIELAGEPRRRLGHVSRALESAPVRVVRG